MPSNDYLQIKQKLNLLTFEPFKGIQMGNVLAMDILYALKPKSDIKSFIHSIKHLLLSLFFDTYQYKLEHMHSSKSIFLFSHHYWGRKDHFFSFSNTLSLFDCKDTMLGEIIKPKIKLKNLKALKYLFLWFFGLKNLGLSFSQKIYIISSLIKCSNLYHDVLEQLDISRYKIATSFYDAQVFDNLFTQYLKLKGIKTAAFQHGHFLPYKFSGSISLENFTSDYLLAWGEYTKKLAIDEGIEETRIKVIGSLKSIFNSNEEVRSTPNNIFGVVLDSELMRQDNYELIHCANLLSQKTGLKYIVRFHPTSNIRSYDNVLDKNCLIGISKDSVLEYANSVYFSLLYGSTVYMELYQYSSPVLRRIGGDYEVWPHIVWDTFCNDTELLEKYKCMSENIANWMDKVYETANLLIVKENVRQNYMDFFTDFIK